MTKTKGFTYRLQDVEKTAFVFNTGVTNGVKIGIINHRYDGLISGAKFDSEVFIPNEDFVEFCETMNQIGADIKKEEKKKQKFIGRLEEEVREKQSQKKQAKKGKTK